MSRLKVFLRHCNKSAGRKQNVRPDWFSYEKCYRSVKNANIDLYILIDGTKENHHFKFDSDDSIYEFTGGDDASSLLQCLYYIEQQNFNDDDIIYIIEDDYLHRPGWDIIMLEAFDTFDVDYVTLYDHADKYFLDIYESLQSKILHSKSIHWRSTPSTCNTYAGKWKTFKKHWNDFHIKYCLPEFTHGGYDHTKFLELWKSGSNLISCIPGYSTHVHNPFMSPVINWEELC